MVIFLYLVKVGADDPRFRLVCYVPGLLGAGGQAESRHTRPW